MAAAEGLAQEQQAKVNALRVTASAPPAQRIVISIPDRKLALMRDGQIVKVYPVAVGTPATPSPRGTFNIANRIPRPTYYAPGKAVLPGRSNPLGTRWLGLSRKGYGIHGTNEPRSIGRRASHGCIRMRNRDVEELFELVRIGDPVELHGERNAQLAQIFGTPAGPVTAPAQQPVPLVLATIAGR